MSKFQHIPGMPSRQSLINIGRRPNAALRLFCLPYAGSSANAYSSWRSFLPESIDLWGVDLPGHGSRFSELPLANIREMRDELGPEIERLIDRPFAIFGHSMGGLLAFELALWLRSRAVRRPDRVFFSGCNPPHKQLRETAENMLTRDKIRERLLSLDGTPPEVLENPDLLEMVMPALQADFSACDTYQCLKLEPLDHSISVFIGRSDRGIVRQDLREWQRCSSRGATLQVFSGGHFFIKASEATVVGAVTATLGNVEHRRSCFA